MGAHCKDRLDLWLDSKTCNPPTCIRLLEKVLEERDSFFLREDWSMMDGFLGDVREASGD